MPSQRKPRLPATKKPTVEFRPYKIIIQLVVQQLENGQVVDEGLSEPHLFFDRQKALEFLSKLDKHVAKASVRPTA